MPDGSTFAPDELEALEQDLARFSMDPLGFVLWAFPWGEQDTALQDAKIERWQAAAMARIKEQLEAGADAGAVVREASRAGHGVGKSAFVSWLILWAVMTYPETRGVVTANTETQLRTKTWPEVTKWFHLCIAKDLFQITATSLFYKGEPAYERTWRIDAVPWSAANPAAFAGLHNRGKRVLIIFDEASEIADIIYETAEGICSDADTQIVWACYGNPTQTVGRFAEIWQSDKHRRIWRNAVSIDSRDVTFSNKAQIQEWLETYGEDSDFFRVRVRGLPPRMGSTNFFDSEQIMLAQRRRLDARNYAYHPKLLGIDVARFGDDATVFTMRQHLKVWPQVEYQGLPTDQVAARAIDTFRQEGCSHVFVDGTGLGAGVVDQLKAAGIPVTDVVANATAQDDRKYHSVRDECYGRLRELYKEMELPPSEALQLELEAQEYGFDAKMRIQLISKKDMKKLRSRSPDHSDSLAITCFPVVQAAPRNVTAAPVKRRKVVL